MPSKDKKFLSSFPAAILAVAILAPHAALSADRVEFGVYDPAGALSTAPGINIQHFYAELQNPDVVPLAAQIAAAGRLGREVLVTLEPWTIAQDRVTGKETLLTGVANGLYDGTITSICSALGATGKPSLVRFAQEMEDTSDVFPWAGQSPSNYISAYRHVTQVCRLAAPLAQFVWSPATVNGAAQYYPGADVVDYVSASVFALEKWDVENRGAPIPARQHIAESLYRGDAFGKPFIISEFGVSGDEKQKIAWLHEIDEMRAGQGVPANLVAIVYFDSPESFSWPAPYGAPDWRIKSQDLASPK